MRDNVRAVESFEHPEWPTTGKLIDDIEELEDQYARM